MFVVGYWPSYNIPFYPEVYHQLGYDHMLNLSRLYFTDNANYQMSARAKIFRRDQGNVVDMKSMQDLMRSNGMYLARFCSVSNAHSKVEDNFYDVIEVVSRFGVRTATSHGYRLRLQPSGRTAK